MMPFAALAEGMLALLSPCVWPVLPALLAVAAAVGERSGARWAAGALALALAGFVALFVAAGLAATVPGRLVRAGLGEARLLGALALAGALLLVATRARPDRTRAARVLWGAAALGAGVGLAAGWTPCIGPALSTALLAGSMPGRALQGTAGLLLYSAGLALPLLALGAGVGRLGAAARVGRRRRFAVRAVCAAAFALTALLLATGRLAELTARLAALGPVLTP